MGKDVQTLQLAFFHWSKRLEDTREYEGEPCGVCAARSEQPWSD